ncbi:MAG: DUF4126 family protein [bacterium]
MTDRNTATTALVLLAAATGARSMLGLAATTRALETHAHAPGESRSTRLLRGDGVRLALTTCAALELVADKLPFIPDRTDPAPLVGRAVAGALIGAAVSDLIHRNRTTGALVGAATAIGAAYATFHIRQALMDALPPVTAALVEDTMMVGIASAGAAMLD